MYTWTITEFSELVSGYYSWGALDRSGGTTLSSLKESDGDNLMKYFNVTKPGDLTGKVIKSDSPDIFEALELLVFSVKFNGHYKPPSDKLIFAKVARDLSQMKEPDLSDIDRYTVYRAFQKVYESKETKQKWLKWLKSRVRKLSQGTVSLKNARGVKFNNSCFGEADYLILTSKNKVQKLIIGPYGDAVTFEA
jgi:hypothetical protein